MRSIVVAAVRPASNRFIEFVFEREPDEYLIGVVVREAAVHYALVPVRVGRVLGVVVVRRLQQL